MQDNSTQLAHRKRKLRLEAAVRRDGLPLEQRAGWSAQVCNHAWSWIAAEGVQSLLAYAPFRSELDCRPLLSQAWAAGREVQLPRVHKESCTLSIQTVHSWDELALGAYGIPEPVMGNSGPVGSHDTGSGLISGLPEVVFVPGLVFDQRGGRLGYGRGYYDRLRAAWEAGLATAAARPLWVGLAYSLQLVPEVPLEEHDGLMDMLITENGIWDCRKEKMR